MRPNTPPPSLDPSLSRKRSHSCSPTKAHRNSFTRTDLFSIPLGLTGYTILYQPGWSVEATASRFLSEHSLGSEWRSRVEAVVSGQVIPAVADAVADAEEARGEYRGYTGLERHVPAKRARISIEEPGQKICLKDAMDVDAEGAEVCVEVRKDSEMSV